MASESEARGGCRNYDEDEERVERIGTVKALKKTSIHNHDIELSCDSHDKYSRDNEANTRHHGRC